MACSILEKLLFLVDLMDTLFFGEIYGSTRKLFSLEAYFTADFKSKTKTDTANSSI